MTLAVYAAAAVAEIAGCFAFWAWLRLGRHWAWTLPGVGCLVLFALPFLFLGLWLRHRLHHAIGRMDEAVAQTKVMMT